MCFKKSASSVSLQRNLSLCYQSVLYMEAYGAILNLVVPIFFLLFFIEKGFEWYLGKKVIRGLDSVSSFSSGITNVV